MLVNFPAEYKIHVEPVNWASWLRGRLSFRIVPTIHQSTLQDEFFSAVLLSQQLQHSYEVQFFQLRHCSSPGAKVPPIVKMGIASQALYFLLHPNEFRNIVQWYVPQRLRPRRIH